MKTTLSACLVLVVLGFGGLLMGQENSGAKIEFKEVRHHFGTVARGAQVSHVFEVRNAGNEPLVIERLEPS